MYIFTSNFKIYNMALRTLKQEIINEIDINNLLIKFTPSKIAFFLNTTEDYIYKTANLQRIESEEKFKNNIYSSSDEMKIGRRGSWMLSKERKVIQQIKNEEI